MASAAEKIMSFPEKSPYRPETAEAFIAGHDAFARANAAPKWVQTLRRQSAQALAAQGLPTPRLERWKYTNLIPAVKGFGTTVAAADIVFIDAHNFASRLSEAEKAAPDWLRDWQATMPACEEKYKDSALWHLGNAYLRDGVVIDIPAKAVADTPIEIIVTGQDGALFMTRNFIRVGDNAEATIIEHHTGAGRFWNNSVTQIIVGKNAKLHHYRVQGYGLEATYTQTTHVQIGRDATYETFALTTGAGLSRNQIHAELQGANGTCNTYGINLLRGRQLGDTTITIDHKAPHCNSNQFYRTVLDDMAHGVFQGKVHVHQVAQKTDGYQLSNALILSEGAEMSTKPELEIYADDVKCSHGATTGQVDENALFYLRSRGLDREQAQALLITAFVAEVAERLADQVLNNDILEKAAAWLDR